MSQITTILKEGIELARKKRFQEAIDKFLESIELASDDARGWYGLGICCVRAGQLEEACEALEAAARLGHRKAARALKRVRRSMRARQPSPEGKVQAGLPPHVASTGAPAASERGAPPEEGVRIDLGRRVRIMLVEREISERETISGAVHGTLAGAQIVETPLAESASRTIVSMGIFDAAIVDWDTSPQGARSLLDFLKLKQPDVPVIALVQSWEGTPAQEIIRAGADYCVVKTPGHASILPYILEQMLKQPTAAGKRSGEGRQAGPSKESQQYLDALNVPVLLTDRQGIVLFANVPAAELAHATPERLTGKHCGELFRTPEGGKEFFPIDQAVAQNASVTVERSEAMTGQRFLVTTEQVPGTEGQCLHTLRAQPEDTTTAPSGADSAGQWPPNAEPQPDATV